MPKRTVFGLAGGLLLTACMSNAGSSGSSWTGMPGASFPAQVQSIDFPNGLVLDASNGMRWGAWSVRFGSRPIAYHNQDDHIAKFIHITGLRCINAIEGEKECMMFLTFFKSDRVYRCQIMGGTREITNINCPSALRLTGQ